MSENKPKKRFSFFTFFLSICAILVVGLLTFYMTIGLVQVTGKSMSPTFKDNQGIIVNKVKTPKRFDIVMLDEIRKDGTSTPIIKRVIGMPGDDVTVLDGELYVNGIKYDEPYVASENRVKFDKSSFHTKVPSNMYFVMGDNRDNSTDSRQVGNFKESALTGVLQEFKGVK